MTKRDLLKWLEGKSDEAKAKASKRKNDLITELKEKEYEKLGLNEFIDSVVPLYQQILDKYEEYIKRIDETENVSIGRYYYRFGYGDLTSRYTNTKDFKEIMQETVRINTPEYIEKREILHKELMKVGDSYNTVIQTVQNLPTAKDGLEYLKKLGFDISEIQPAVKKKQLPATISVNVDTKYLLLDREKRDEQTIN